MSVHQLDCSYGHVVISQPFPPKSWQSTPSPKALWYVWYGCVSELGGSIASLLSSHRRCASPCSVSNYKVFCQSLTKVLEHDPLRQNSNALKSSNLTSQEHHVNMMKKTQSHLHMERSPMGRRQGLPQRNRIGMLAVKIEIARRRNLCPLEPMIDDTHRNRQTTPTCLASRIMIKTRQQKQQHPTR